MSQLISSLDAYKYLRASMTGCSWKRGWRSLLLRTYEDPSEVEDFTTPATNDHLIVLVTGGSCEIEVQYANGWKRALQRRGSVSMTAPGDSATLRWRGAMCHSTLQLHLPEATIRQIEWDLRGKDNLPLSLGNRLASSDPLIERVMLDLAAALREGAPDLYADTAAHLLAAHLLTRFEKARPPSYLDAGDRRLRRVDAFMRENLVAPLSLGALAKEAGISSFHLLRMFKQAYGETPLKRLTRFRMERAKWLLRRSAEPITTIAFQCGYENSAHFATAFRRQAGVSPSAFRRQK
jgi:AraC family transcriptional regulator